MRVQELDVGEFGLIYNFIMFMSTWKAILINLSIVLLIFVWIFSVEIFQFGEKIIQSIQKTIEEEKRNLNIKPAKENIQEKNKDLSEKLSEKQYSQKLTDYENNIKKMWYNPIDCIDLKQVKNINNPVDIYIGVYKCFEEKKYKKAVKLQLLAKIFWIYDTKRVADKSAHQAITVLSMNFQNSIWADQRLVWIETMAKFVETKNIQEVCGDIRRIWVPKYYPKYMINHWMWAMKSALEGKKIKDWLIEINDEEKVFEEVLEQYLHCEESKNPEFEKKKKEEMKIMIETFKNQLSKIKKWEEKIKRIKKTEAELPQIQSKIQCVDIKKITNRHTASQIYAMAEDCIQLNKLKKATKLELIWRAFTMYDFYRSYGEINNQVRFEERLKRKLTEKQKISYGLGSFNRDEFRELCDVIKRIWSPRYYIQISDKTNPTKEMKDMPAKLMWDLSLNSVHCSKEN